MMLADIFYDDDANDNDDDNIYHDVFLHYDDDNDEIGPC